MTEHFQPNEVKPPSLMDVLMFHRTNIEAALAYATGTHTFDDVCGRVLSGKAYLFANADACAICEEVFFARSKSLHVWLAGGTLEGILALTPQAEEAATQLGSDKLTLTGRQGFVRALKAHGWKPVHITMEREIGGEE